MIQEVFFQAITNFWKVKGFEVDEKPQDDYTDIGGLDK